MYDLFLRKCSARPFPQNPLEWFDYFTCRIPAETEEGAIEFLEIVGGGGGLGAGWQMKKIGADMPVLRTEYEHLLEKLSRDFALKKATKMSPHELAKWVVKERTSIARSIRLKQGMSPTVLFELRDNVKYGLGGRTFANMERHALKQGFKEGAEVYGHLMTTALKSNTGITNTMLKSAKFLKNGGVVTLIVTVPTELYILLTAPEGQLERVIYEEAGSLGIGALGSSAGVGLCLVFGIATSGWGLLACGALGGIGGGFAGTYAGNQLYYSTHRDRIIYQSETTGVIESQCLVPTIP